MHERLWRDVFVADINIAVLVAEIRAALGDDARRPRFLRTVHRFGYAFCGTVEGAPGLRGPAPALSTCWLAWGAECAPLRFAETVLGRGPEADIRIDAVGVSRRHAMIVVARDQVTLHDLSSKNGTYVDDVRVTSPVTLSDGVEVRLGPVPVFFRRLVDGVSTETVNASRSPRARP